MGDAADGGSGLPQMDDQEQIQVRFVEGWSYSIVIVSSCCDYCWYGRGGVWKLSWWQGAASQVKAKLALQVLEVRKLTIRAV